MSDWVTRAYTCTYEGERKKGKGSDEIELYIWSSNGAGEPYVGFVTGFASLVDIITTPVFKASVSVTYNARYRRLCSAVLLPHWVWAPAIDRAFESAIQAVRRAFRCWTNVLRFPINIKTYIRNVLFLPPHRSFTTFFSNWNDGSRRICWIFVVLFMCYTKSYLINKEQKLS